MAIIHVLGGFPGFGFENAHSFDPSYTDACAAIESVHMAAVTGALKLSRGPAAADYHSLTHHLGPCLNGMWLA